MGEMGRESVFDIALFYPLHCLILLCVYDFYVCDLALLSLLSFLLRTRELFALL